MAVKIVTDSLSDITSDLAKELGITIVPLTVSFGPDSFLDRITITTDEFYRRLSTDPIWPTTTQPPPGTFAEIYNKLVEETDEILVIVVSKKLSGTYDSATNAKTMVEKECRIEVIDSETVVMGLGLIVIAAAKACQAGASMDELIKLVHSLMARSNPIMSFDTLKYLAKGGRIGKAKSLMGALLSVKPILTIRDGEVSPVTKVRTRAAGIDYLCNYVAGFSNIQEMAVEYATTEDEADMIIERLGSAYPKERIYKSTVSPVIGTYAGPNILSVTVLEGE
ncbi:DegV family protein [Chloroflexota bacterium]